MVLALAPCHPLPDSAAEPITVLKDSVSGGGSEGGLDLDARLLLEVLWDLYFASRLNNADNAQQTKKHQKTMLTLLTFQTWAATTT